VCGQDRTGFLHRRLDADFVYDAGDAFHFVRQGFRSFADEPIIGGAEQVNLTIDYLHADAIRVDHLVLFQSGLHFVTEALIASAIFYNLGSTGFLRIGPRLAVVENWLLGHGCSPSPV